jgi:hypothetical protein
MSARSAVAACRPSFSARFDCVDKHRRIEKVPAAVIRLSDYSASKAQLSRPMVAATVFKSKLG